MSVSNYISHKKELYNILLAFIDDDSDKYDSYDELINQIKLQQIDNNHDELQEFFQMIVDITNNHHRSKSFNAKIHKILLIFKEQIKQTFSNSTLFYIFGKSKLIILILLKEKIITFDESIYNLFNLNSDYKHFFYEELFQFFSEFEKGNIKKIENFESKREIGENDSYICSLIRDDLVDEFIVYVNKNNFSLSSQINDSVFETNSFLINRKTSLIEYAAFFGSIQIFHFLQFNNVPLNSSLWLYVIHGRNPELIHFLEENNIEPTDKSYEECLEESIKCHHNEIAIYIKNNLLNKSNENDFNHNLVAYSYHYHNYDFIPEYFDSKFCFYYLCEFGYINLVKHFLRMKEFDINEKII